MTTSLDWYIWWRYVAGFNWEPPRAAAGTREGVGQK